MPMMRYLFFSAVIESCHPYPELVGGKDAGKCIEICGEDARDRQVGRRNSGNHEELMIAPTSN